MDTLWTLHGISTAYCDPQNDKAPYDSTKIAYWFPMTQYIGALRTRFWHLLYSRFWCKVMRDIGLITHNEPIARLFTQGMVQKGGGAMSKSRGNVGRRGRHGAEIWGGHRETLYTFCGTSRKDLEWSEESIEGSWRFLNRVYRLVETPLCGGPRSEKQKDRRGDGSPKEKILLRKSQPDAAASDPGLRDALAFQFGDCADHELTNEIYLQEAAGKGRGAGSSQGMLDC